MELNELFESEYHGNGTGYVRLKGASDYWLSTPKIENEVIKDIVKNVQYHWDWVEKECFHDEGTEHAYRGLKDFLEHGTTGTTTSTRAEA